MDYGCPVCNGLTAIAASCGSCGTVMEDLGRSDESLGPYAPYRPIDDMKLTNGYNDLSAHRCVHQIYCPQCKQTMLHSVDEWKI